MKRKSARQHAINNSNLGTDKYIFDQYPIQSFLLGRKPSFLASSGVDMQTGSIVSTGNPAFLK